MRYQIEGIDHTFQRKFFFENRFRGSGATVHEVSGSRATRQYSDRCFFCMYIE